MFLSRESRVPPAPTDSKLVWKLLKGFVRSVLLHVSPAKVRSYQLS